jgi:hypothetical protein
VSDADDERTIELPLANKRQRASPSPPGSSLSTNASLKATAAADVTPTTTLQELIPTSTSQHTTTSTSTSTAGDDDARRPVIPVVNGYVKLNASAAKALRGKREANAAEAA